MKLYLICISLSLFLSCSQEKKKNMLNKEAQKYLSDYNEFVDTLQTYHPALYEFTSKKIFDKKIKDLRQKINNNTSKKDFIWNLSEIISLASCGHTSLGFFNQERDLLTSKEYFPLLTRLINNKLYVINNLNNKSSIAIGDEIIEINNKPINKIIKNIYNHIPSQANIKTPKKMMFNGYNTSYIPYVLNFPDNYTIKTSTGKKFTLNPLNEFPPYPPLYSKTHPCQKDFCLTEINEKTILLTLRNFAYYGEKTEVFTSFLDRSFLDIKEKKYLNLIIDVRGNLGGPGSAGIHLLKYTLQTPFRYFSKDGSDFGKKELQHPFTNNFGGKIFFIMNGEGYSTIGHLASIFKDRNRVVFIGDTLGSNQFCSANQKPFRLTNTSINYTVARNNFFTDVKEKDRKSTISPDIKFEQSIEDFLIDKDVVLLKTIELAKKDIN